MSKTEQTPQPSRVIPSPLEALLERKAGDAPRHERVLDVVWCVEEGTL